MERLRSALEWCWRQAGQGLDIDGGSFQDEMVERGLLREVPASPMFAAEYDVETMFVPAWSTEG